MYAFQLKHPTFVHVRLWCSSSTAPSHGVDPGAIPGRRMCIFDVLNSKELLRCGTFAVALPIGT